MTINEEWKPINDYPNYMISNLGRVKSVERTCTTKNRWGEIERVVNEKILKTTSGKDGYIKVVLCKNSKAKTFLVHRLVATHFIPNPENLPCVNHRDENPSNPTYTNLEWCSHKYNSNYGTSKERISEKHIGKILTSEHKSKIAEGHNVSIIQYDKDMNLITIWASGKEAEMATGISAGNISHVCKGKRKTAGGCIWKYNTINKICIC